MFLVLTTPGFLKDGIDFEQLVLYYLANNCYIEITDPAEVDLVIKLMRRVIGDSYGYKDDFASTEHGRFQMIFNSVLEESLMQKVGLNKKSNAVWLLTETYERGTDFQSSNGKHIEAKVYRDWDSMKAYAKKGSESYTIFHGADYVLCYLVNSYESKHWWWLKNNNGIYDVHYDHELNSITSECLPASIPICYCKLSTDRLIIGKNKFCM